MAFNGSGIFQRIYNWQNDRDAAVKIRADRMDTEMDGMATGLSNCITKDGQSTVTQNIPMNSKKFTGLVDGVDPQDSATTAQVTAVSDIVTANTASLGRRNIIIGGDFSTNPWQLGTSFPAISSGAVFADMWKYFKNGSMVHTITKEADAPTVAEAGVFSTHCAMVDCTTIDSSIAAGESAYIEHRVEGYNFIPIAQRTFTISFWHKHTKPGIYCVSFRNSGADRSYVSEYTQSVSDTWEKATVTVSASPSAGTWDYTNGVGLRVSFPLAVGATLQTTADAWQSGVYLATSSHVNACDSVSNNFRIALVQPEPGAVATVFEQRLVSEILQDCKRYYETGSVTYSGEVVSGRSYTYRQPFTVTKRTTPTMGLAHVSEVNFSTITGFGAANTQIFTEARSANGTGAGQFTTSYVAEAWL